MGAVGLFSGFAVLDFSPYSWLGRCRIKAPEQVAAGSGSELKILLTVSAVLAIFGFAAFEAANNAQFTYIERFGVSLGISDHKVGFSLLIASLVGIPGAFSHRYYRAAIRHLAPTSFGMLSHWEGWCSPGR